MRLNSEITLFLKIFLLYLSHKLVESVTKFIEFSFAYCSISSLDVSISGLITLLLTGVIPQRPLLPEPLIRLNKIV